MVCLSVGDVHEPCENGWTNRDADWRVDWVGPKEPCDICRSRSLYKKRILGLSGPMKSIWVTVTAAVYAAKKNQQRHQRDCCSQLHCSRLAGVTLTFPSWKIPLLRCGLSSKFFDHLLLLHIMKYNNISTD